MALSGGVCSIIKLTNYYALHTAQYTDHILSNKTCTLPNTCNCNYNIPYV